MSTMTMTWTGKAVSVNRWHVIRAGRISPSREYEGFVDELAKAIWAQIPLDLRPQLPWKRAELRIVAAVRVTADHHNLTKPICDALVHARVVEDDRLITRVDCEAAPEHGRRELDVIRLTVREVAG